MNTQLESWHPVILAIIKSQPDEQAASAILSLMPQMMSNVSLPAPTPAPAPAPSPPPGRPRLRAVSSDAPAVGPSDKPFDERMEKDGTLKNYEWFSIKEAAEYIGVKVNTVHERVRRHPEKLVITKAAGKKREEYRLRGRELNEWKEQRSNGAVLATADDSDGVPPGAERGAGRFEQ